METSFDLSLSALFFRVGIHQLVLSTCGLFRGNFPFPVHHTFIGGLDELMRHREHFSFLRTLVDHPPLLRSFPFYGSFETREFFSQRPQRPPFRLHPCSCLASTRTLSVYDPLMEGGPLLLLKRCRQNPFFFPVVFGRFFRRSMVTPLSLNPPQGVL